MAKIEEDETLSTEEREAKDLAEKKKEEEEQAGM